MIDVIRVGRRVGVGGRVGGGGRVEEGGDAKIKVVLFGMLVEETV